MFPLVLWCHIKVFPFLMICHFYIPLKPTAMQSVLYQVKIITGLRIPYFSKSISVPYVTTYWNNFVHDIPWQKGLAAA